MRMRSVSVTLAMTVASRFSSWHSLTTSVALLSATTIAMRS